MFFPCFLHILTIHIYPGGGEPCMSTLTLRWAYALSKFILHYAVELAFEIRFPDTCYLAQNSSAVWLQGSAVIVFPSVIR